MRVSSFQAGIKACAIVSAIAPPEAAHGLCNQPTRLLNDSFSKSVWKSKGKGLAKEESE